MYNAPWAKLMTFSTPKTIFSPTAMTNSSKPISRLLSKARPKLLMVPPKVMIVPPGAWAGGDVASKAA